MGGSLLVWIYESRYPDDVPIGAILLSLAFGGPIAGLIPPLLIVWMILLTVRIIGPAIAGLLVAQAGPNLRF